MATYDRLPVYRASYDFLVEAFGFVKTFPREYKYTLGESIKQELLDMIRSVYRANGSPERRRHHVSEAREHLEAVRLFLRLTKDLKQVGLEKFVRLNALVEDISKQLYHWEKSLPKTRGPEPEIPMGFPGEPES